MESGAMMFGALLVLACLTLLPLASIALVIAFFKWGHRRLALLALGIGGIAGILATAYYIISNEPYEPSRSLAIAIFAWAFGPSSFATAVISMLVSDLTNLLRQRLLKHDMAEKGSGLTTR